MSQIDTYKIGNSSYSIAPGWGCNLFSWIVDGRELMYCPQEMPETAQKITGGGTPILFPSVGRTWDFSSGKPVPGFYRIEGQEKTYFMPSHGIVFLSRFEKTSEATSDDAVTAEYTLVVPEKVREENYPFDVALVQRFTMKPGEVVLEGIMTNNGTSPAPCAFGYHPYFAVSNNERKGIQVTMPVTKQVLLTHDTVLPTGETKPTDGIFDLQPEIYYDLAFTGVTGTRMTLKDEQAGHSINVDFDGKCESLVLYSPDGSDFVCIEPWTRGLGGFMHLNQPGWEEGKIIPMLKPGEVMKFKVTFSVSK